jgi:hypothetical protein
MLHAFLLPQCVLYVMPISSSLTSSFYKILSVIVVLVFLVFKIYFISSPKATRRFEPISYRGVLLSTLLHAIVYILTQLAECTSRLQIKWDYKKKKMTLDRRAQFNYGRRDPSRWPRGTFYPQRLALTSTSGGRSVGIVRSRAQANELCY